VHPDSSLNTIAHHDLLLRDANFRGTPEYFLAYFMISRHLALHLAIHDATNCSLIITLNPTSVELLIYNLPLSILLSEPANRFPSLLKSISNTIDIPIFVAGFLQSDYAKRVLKLTTSVVVAVDPIHVSRFGESIRQFACIGSVAPAYSTFKSTQCRKCWRFGHSAPLCKEEA